ncbi:dynactin subunit 4-like [Homarus americanus]|uniref:dynactin subunit 4-like n=1 Tax=Homarus americanus TaxID=6706 RepID=UPI001C472641|nr:dynactin subunit 4-like [Homarus americanus]
MAHLFKVDRVRLLCSCGVLKPITAIYFCRHCLKLRCGNCVSHEVDTLFCPNCLENMPSTEARLKKNRCANCFDCPSCCHTLSTRATSIQAPSPEDSNKTVARKVYYLACTSCRWTSRDVGLKDQTVATGGWSEQDNEHYKYLQSLLEHYRSVAQQEKLDRERKRFSHRKSAYLSLTDKYSLPSLLGRKSLTPLSPYAPKGDSSQSLDMTASEATAEVEGLPDEIFTEEVVLSSVTDMEQRMASPEWQPEKTSDLYPLHKHILVKRSLRCRHCEHNLSKPEYNPSSIKFKIQLGAFYHVPEVRMIRQVELKSEVETCVQVSLCNPTPHDMTLAFLPFVPEAYTAMQQKVEEPTDGGSLNTSSMVRVVDIPPEKTDLTPSADVALPQGQVILAARDDTAEYDDQDSISSYKDDPLVVAWRRANKVGINLLVTPKANVSRAKVGFVLRYDYTNTVATASESRTVTLNIPVMVDVGTVSE